MGLNDLVSAERIHIGFFGMRNAGKSSVVNAVTGQNLAVVSDVMGTTTDPVKKAMELLPMGPVVIIDTPGIDDEGMLGELRVKRARQVLNETDIAVLVVDAEKGMRAADRELLELIQEKKIPYLIAYNKSDLLDKTLKAAEDALVLSAKTGTGVFELKERIAHLAMAEEHHRRLIGDLVQENDLVVLVVPIDSAAPKGRLILPQQQTIRDLLESGAIPVVTRETELPAALSSLTNAPAFVVTDSQAFERVAKDVPEDIPLTSFSILFARYKGNLQAAVRGAAQLDRLCDGDTVLISEGCTHHRQCDDIGTVKMPHWIKKYTGKTLNYEFTSGGEFPEELSKYSLILHCGGCMLNEREMQHRGRQALDQKIPMTNYGTAIAHMHGILRRSLELFPEINL